MISVAHLKAMFFAYTKLALQFFEILKSQMAHVPFPLGPSIII